MCTYLFWGLLWKNGPYKVVAISLSNVIHIKTENGFV